jgi:hypothetical protein
MGPFYWIYFAFVDENYCSFKSPVHQQQQQQQVQKVSSPRKPIRKFSNKKKKI